MRPLAALVLALLAAPAAAQSLELAFSDGVLGSQVEYALQGPAGDAFVLLPSLSPGPTPLALVDPADPRVLSVGLDLAPLWALGALDAAGAATAAYPLPLLPALHGLPVYAQGVTLFGAATLVDLLSNPASFVLAAAGEAWPALSDDVVERRFAPATPLDDGRVLLAGGQTPSAPPAFHDGASLFDPTTQTFGASAATLPVARARHTATLLADGRVLVAGGVGAGGVLASCALYDPATDAFAPAAPLAEARALHAAARLADGRVVVIGGSSGFDAEHPIGWPSSVLAPVRATTEVYDPAADAWSPGPALPLPLTAPQATVLGDGRVLVAGGIEAASGFAPRTTEATWLLDPAATTLLPGPDMPGERMHQARTTTASGDALLVGGARIDFATLATTVHADTWIFDAGADAWTSGPDAPQSIRCGVVICLFENGKYVLGNGLSYLDLATGAHAYDTGLYVLDAALASWSTLGALAKPRLGGAMVAIDGGVRVLVAGSPAPGDASAEVAAAAGPGDC